MYGTLISSVTVGAGGAASISFTSVPGTFSDIVIVASLRDGNATDVSSAIIQYNGDTSSGNYVDKTLFGTGSAAASTEFVYPFAYIPGANATSNTFGNLQLYIPNYSGATQKTASMDAVHEQNATAGRQVIQAVKWTGTAAITSIQIKPNNGSNFAQYSTAYLYGLTKGSGGATVS